MNHSNRPSRPHLWISRLAAAIGLSLLFAHAHADTPSAPPTLRNIVLVHGAFADGSSWAAVMTRLQTMGYHVTAVQNTLNSLAEDVSRTEQVLDRQTGDVLLVGHSWAGAVITQAGNATKVKGLVYLSALVPDSGESVADLLQRIHAPMEGLKPDNAGLIWLDDPHMFQQVMASDLPFDQARELAAVQQPIAAAAFAEKIAHAAWHDKPSWYVLTEQDHALLPAVQHTLARQIAAKTVSIAASHMSMISQAQAVADLIDRAAREVAQLPSPHSR